MTFHLDEFLPYRLSVAASQISRRFAARYAKEAGLTIPEWRVLAHLDHSGAVSVRDIHARVNLDKSMVSRAASRLEKAGFLRKSGHDTDRRLIVMELTPAGRDLMARLGQVATGFQAELLSELGEDAAALDRALRQLASRG
ncbi:MarR family winged helix-turn-helix transcriptional regulator [Paracoccus sp. YLB-12]|uniref:MarR family winged helix-turn-helix transcriptional regulator n=1 Tax=Paracoccus maritimus TaxID=2933292 RepID=A0ABT2K679_9RHOB|nr:MarR family winged helix-turn-helix transcriptional regulator [Paracoccus sp. YLB-12]MCT4331414.1 MarR family winged helix-turn-helix transcriptional regulator [Paracoccus sp. YLB-12]